LYASYTCSVSDHLGHCASDVFSIQYYVWQAKLQKDVAKWVAVHLEATIEDSVIQDTLKFVEFLRRTTRELTPANHRVLDFFRQLEINGYDIASRKIDAEV